MRTRSIVWIFILFFSDLGLFICQQDLCLIKRFNMNFHLLRCGVLWKRFSLDFKETSKICLKKAHIDFALFFFLRIFSFVTSGCISHLDFSMSWRHSDANIFSCWASEMKSDSYTYWIESDKNTALTIIESLLMHTFLYFKHPL